MIFALFLLVALAGCDSNSGLTKGERMSFALCSAGISDPCKVQTSAWTEQYKIIVFGSLEPDINQTIADFLNQESDMKAVVANSDKCINDDMLSHFNVVVDYDHNGTPPDQEAALQKFAAAGGRVIALHHSIYDACGPMYIKHALYGSYLPVTSAQGIYHLVDEFINGPYQVILTDPGNPVFNTLATDGTVHYKSTLVPEGDYPYHTINVSDERYLEITFVKNDLHILLSTIFNGTNYDIGWYRNEGLGKYIITRWVI